MVKIIGVLGKKRHGKDTIADYLVKCHGYEKYTLAEPMKNACKILFDFTDKQLYGSDNDKETIDDKWGVSPRTVLQYLGTDIFRKDINKIIPGINDNFWIENLKDRIKNKDTKIVISDIRFQNEVDQIHKMSGIIIKINRPTLNNTDQHVSESSIDKITNYDILMENNNSLENLYNKIDDAMKNIV